jgi:hypothetical protein
MIKPAESRFFADMKTRILLWFFHLSPSMRVPFDRLRECSASGEHEMIISSVRMLVIELSSVPLWRGFGGGWPAQDRQQKRSSLFVLLNLMCSDIKSKKMRYKVINHGL